MTQSARLFVSIALVLVLPGVAGAVQTEFRALDGVKAVPDAQFTFEGAGETKTATTDASGKATVDLQPGMEYRARESAWSGNLKGYWSSSKYFTTPSTTDKPIDFPVTPVQATDLWTPPGGVLTVAPVYQSINVSDMEQKKDVRTDTVLNVPIGPFINHADAQDLRQRNNDVTNAFNVQMGGIYLGVRSPR